MEDCNITLYLILSMNASVGGKRQSLRAACRKKFFGKKGHVIKALKLVKLINYHVLAYVPVYGIVGCLCYKKYCKSLGYS